MLATIKEWWARRMEVICFVVDHKLRAVDTRHIGHFKMRRCVCTRCGSVAWRYTDV